MSENMVYGRTPIPELIEMTLCHLNERGYSPQTVENYRRVYDKMREYSLQTHISFQTTVYSSRCVFAGLSNAFRGIYEKQGKAEYCRGYD